MASIQTLARSALTSCYCPVVKQKCSKEFSINACEVIFRNYFSLIYYPPFPPLILISSSPSSSSFNGPWDQIPPWNNLRKGVLLILSRVSEGLVCGLLSLCLWINCESEQHAGRSCCSKQEKKLRRKQGCWWSAGFLHLPSFLPSEPSSYDGVGSIWNQSSSCLLILSGNSLHRCSQRGTFWIIQVTTNSMVTEY